MDGAPDLKQWSHDRTQWFSSFCGGEVKRDDMRCVSMALLVNWMFGTNIQTGLTERCPDSDTLYECRRGRQDRFPRRMSFLALIAFLLDGLCRITYQRLTCLPAWLAVWLEFATGGPCLCIFYWVVSLSLTRYLCVCVSESVCVFYHSPVIYLWPALWRSTYWLSDFKKPSTWEDHA